MRSVIAVIAVMARVDVVDIAVASYAWIVGMGIGMIISLSIVIWKYKHIFV